MASIRHPGLFWDIVIGDSVLVSSLSLSNDSDYLGIVSDIDVLLGVLIIIKYKLLNIPTINILSVPAFASLEIDPYNRYKHQLDTINIPSNKMYNIKELYLERFSNSSIHVTQIKDTIVVLHPYYYFCDLNEITYTCGMKNIYIIRYEHIDSDTNQLSVFDQINIHESYMDMKFIRFQSILWHVCLGNLMSTIRMALDQSKDTSKRTTLPIIISSDHYKRFLKFCQDSSGGLGVISHQVVTKRKPFNSGSHIATINYKRQSQVYYLPLTTFDNLFCHSWRYGFPGYYNQDRSELYRRTVNLIDIDSKIKVLYCCTSNMIKFQLCSTTTIMNDELMNTFLSNRL